MGYVLPLEIDDLLADRTAGSQHELTCASATALPV